MAGPTKAAIYAGAAVTDYWIVNLRDRCVECFADPDPAARLYRRTLRATGTMRLPLDAFAEVIVQAADLFPGA